MKTSKHEGLGSKVLAAMAAAALASAMFAVPAFAVPPADGTPTTDGTQTVDDKAMKGTAKSDTEIWLYVKDKGATTMSVTAPLKIYLAAEVDSTMTEANGAPYNYSEVQYNFAVPSTAAARITNESLNTEVKLDSYTVADKNAYGLPKLASGSDAGFYTSNTEDFSEHDATNLTDAAKVQNHYWLESNVANQGKSVVLDLATTTDSTTLGAMDGADALKMASNNTSGDALYSYLPLALSGQVFNPDADGASGFGIEDKDSAGDPIKTGSQVSVIEWTFKSVTE